jgi:hypothetical protein
MLRDNFRFEVMQEREKETMHVLSQTHKEKSHSTFPVLASSLIPNLLRFL